MSRKISKLKSEQPSTQPKTEMMIRCEQVTKVSQLKPKSGDSLSDLAYARGLVKCLLEKGDIPGAINLMVACRGMVEQAHAQAIKENRLLGVFAGRRLAGDVMVIIMKSLEPFFAVDEDRYYAMVDSLENWLKRELDNNTLF